MRFEPASVTYEFRGYHHPVILGAGVTGLAAGMTSGLPVYEAEESPGGICASYYLRAGEPRREFVPSADGEAYRFEIGGGHWIFGGDALVLRLIEQATSLKRYERASAVYFPKHSRYVPYPLQDHLRFLDRATAARALAEMAQPKGTPAPTMKAWLRQSFGATLSELFFEPFHDLYTAGLYDRIAPQDAYKSPVNISQAILGAFDRSARAGYNVTYVYPAEGLNQLVRWMAKAASVRYGKRVCRVDPNRREVLFADGTVELYTQLLSTLPLNKIAEMSGLTALAKPDPYTSVLVLNIGAVRGEACSDYHWVYVPTSRSGFHRVGFYSNVDQSFLPRSARGSGKRVSLYVERAFPGGRKPSPEEAARYVESAVRELAEWGFIREAEVVDPTWIDVAYTWSWPGSTWVREATARLREHAIYPIGRYGGWTFQGIADSIRDGLLAGSAIRLAGS